MGRRFAFIAGIAFIQAAHSLSLNAIRQKLENQPPVDTVNMRVSVSVQGGGMMTRAQTHVILKGKDKVWMETESPLGRQRMVRNGNRFQVTDLATGKKEYPAVAPEMLGAMSSPSQNWNLLRTGSYREPVAVGNNRYRITLVPGSDTALAGREIIFDDAVGQIVQIMEARKSADTSWTRLEYDQALPVPVPKKISMEVKTRGQNTLVTMDFRDVVKPAGINDKLFEITGP